jgi:hypothetical protein
VGVQLMDAKLRQKHSLQEEALFNSHAMVQGEMQTLKPVVGALLDENS